MLQRTVNNKYLIDNSVIEKISKFFYTDYFYLAVIAVIVTCWATYQTILGFALIILLSAFILVIQRDVQPVLTLVIMATAVMSKIPSNIFAACFLLIPIVIAVPFHIYYYKLENFSIGKCFLAFTLLLIAFLISGIGSRLESSGFGRWVGTFLIVLVPFGFYLITINFASNRENSAENLAKSFVYFGLLIVLEILIYYVFDVKPKDAGVIHLGWAISNSVALVLLLVYPFGFYLYLKTEGYKSYIYLALALIEYIGILATTSRGATIFGSIELVATVIGTLILAKGKKKKEYLYITLALILCGIFVAIVGRSYLIKIYNVIFEDGLRDSGRFELYREAISCFFEYPIVGVGIDYVGNTAKLNNASGIYMFHDTILQIVACLGGVGLLAYLYYYFIRFEILLEKWDLFNYYIFMICIGFEGYSLLDTGTIEGVPCGIMVAVVIAVAEINTNQDQLMAYNKLRKQIKKIKLNKTKTQKVEG